MADRVFAGVLLLVAIGYSFIAFTLIKAPFQYDPLGPESWPRLLGVCAILCALSIIARPDVESMGLAPKTLLRIAILVAMLFAYAAAFQPLGFVVSTFAFCAALSMFLGAAPARALAFGAASGGLGYLLCTVLLDLNLPAGLLQPLL